MYYGTWQNVYIPAVNHGKYCSVDFCRVYINMELILTIGTDKMISRLIQIVTLGLKLTRPPIMSFEFYEH